MYKVVHEREKCIGCGACVAVASEFWEMEEGKAKLKGGKKENGNYVLEVDELKNLKDSAEVCAVNCIHIFDEKGEKII